VKEANANESLRDSSIISTMDSVVPQSLLKVHADVASMRTEFEILRRTATEEIAAFPGHAKEWVGEAATALSAAMSETQLLRNQLATEKAMRKKLSNEVQNLRGTVRVFCRPRPLDDQGSKASKNSITSVTSHGILQLHRDRALPSEDGSERASTKVPLNFEFDRVFSPETTQHEVYTEAEELILSALDGYKICIMAYGQRGTGKTHTIMGDFTVSLGSRGDDASVTVENNGMHFLAAQQLFIIAEHRKEMYQDSFSITVVEVHNEKLRDLLAGTEIGDTLGNIQGGNAGGKDSKSSRRNRSKGREQGMSKDISVPQQINSSGSKVSKPGKLEIRTNYDGDTVVQGLIAVPVKSFDDICRVWQQCLTQRAARLAEQGIDNADYEAESHVITTINIISTNVSTGVGTVGQIQFVDLAAADLVLKRSPPSFSIGKSNSSSYKKTPSNDILSSAHDDGIEYKFKNRSIGTLLDVVSARCQFARSVPYRNSTLTHLIRDSLTADTKVLLLVCVSNEMEHFRETASALRFATQVRKVAIGKATKHTISFA